MDDRLSGHTGDIEEQLPSTTTSIEGQLPSTTTSIEEQLTSTITSDQPAAPTSVADKNPDSSKGHDVDHASSAGFVAKPTFLVTTISCFLWCIVKVIFWFVVSIVFGIYTIGVIFISGDTTGLYFVDYETATPPEQEADKNKRGTRVKMKKPAIKNKIHHLCIVTLVRVGCTILVWMAINLGVPSLRRVAMLGSLLWKWSLLAALISLSYPLLIMLYMTVAFVIVQSGSEGFRGSNVEYCMEGLALSMILVAYFTSFLLTWLLFIDSTNAPLRRYGTLTLASFLVGAVLNVVKSLVLLWWKTKLIYKKYEGKILSAGCQLYFHLLVMDQRPSSCLKLVDWWDWEDYFPKPLQGPTTTPNEGKTRGTEDEYGGRRADRRKNLPIEDYMIEKGVSLKHIHEVATYLTNNFELSLTEDDDIPDMAPILQRKFPSDQRSGLGIETIVCDETCATNRDAQLLLELLQLETQKETPTYDEFEKWMVDGLKNCYMVGHRINGAIEVMRILNRVMTSFVVVVAILIWLFITGFATTKVVVGLASVFLGLTFTFGDTCKTFFQGLIFSFVTHPFDVADRCIIDNKELKVKKINILTTTFFGSRSNEVFLYPNSYLATKLIVLLHGERGSELEDHVEFVLPCSTKAPQVESLQEKIEGYLEEGIQSGHYKKPYRVSLKEIGDNNMKMGVHFQYNLNNGDESEALEVRKDIQRSKFLLQLRKFMDSIGNDVSTT